MLSETGYNFFPVIHDVTPRFGSLNEQTSRTAVLYWQNGWVFVLKFSEKLTDGIHILFYNSQERNQSF